MKRILFFRHGKAEPIAPGQRDYERKLQERGKNDVKKAGATWRLHLQSNLIVYSPAERTLQTAKILAQELELSKNEMREDQRLYEASMHTLLYVINHFPETAEDVIIVGHNPVLEFAISYFCGRDMGELRTSGGVLIEFPFGYWNLISASTGDVKKVV